MRSWDVGVLLWLSIVAGCSAEVERGDAIASQQAPIRNGREAAILNDENDPRQGGREAARVTGAVLNVDDDWICSGVLVGPSTVLTAAHCVSYDPTYSNPRGAVVAPRSMFFQMTNELDFDRLIAVTEIVRHPKYLPPGVGTLIGGANDTGYGGADLALLKLAQPVFSTAAQDYFETRAVHPFGPAGVASGSYPAPLENQFVAGYGLDEQNRIGIKRVGRSEQWGTLSSYELTTYDPATRKGTFREKPSGLTLYDRSPTAQIACPGDSGGGVFDGTPENDSFVNRLYLVGILSTGFAIDPNNRCVQAYGSNYTTVAMYEEWIHATRHALDADIAERLQLVVDAPTPVGSCFPIAVQATNGLGSLARGGVSRLKLDSSDPSTLEVYPNAQCAGIRFRDIEPGTRGFYFYGKFKRAGRATVRAQQAGATPARASDPAFSVQPASLDLAGR